MKLTINKTLLLIVCILSVSISAHPQFKLPDDNYAQRVNESFQKEDWRNGKKILDEGLKKYPRNSDLKTLEGKYYFEWEKNNDKARFALIEALQSDRQNVDAKHILVNVEIASKRYSSAICYINELLEVNPYWKGLWSKKIEVYRLQNNHVEANRLLMRLRQIYPDDEDIRKDFLYHIQEEVRNNTHSGEVDDVISLTNILIKEDPENEEAYVELCNSYLKAGDYEKALVTAERGLYKIPGNIKLITKKTDILSSLYRYDELLDFLQAEIKLGHGDRNELTRKYNYFLQESARKKRKSDVYVTYKSLHNRNPRNDEALNYIVAHATANGLYDEALETINLTRRVRGESKNLLMKEYQVYKQMGATSKANQQIVRLYEMFPEDLDIVEMYVQLRYQQAKNFTIDEQYSKAVENLNFVIQHTDDEDLRQTARMSLFNCYYHTGKLHKALECLDTLQATCPYEPELRTKRAMIYSQQMKYREALGQYAEIIDIIPIDDREIYLNGYDELATVSVKQLVENYDIATAMELVEEWLLIFPRSELGYKYGINLSARMNNFDAMKRYASTAIDVHPDDLYYKVKLAEANNHLKNHEEALNILSTYLLSHPYHTELVNGHTQIAEDYAQTLIKQREYDQAMGILNTALKVNPQNRTLKYWKGVIFEKTNQNDSAYYYQMFYDPAPIEVKAHTDHLEFLKYNAFKNNVSFYYLRSRYADSDRISTIATAVYTRYGSKDTFTGLLNFAGKEDGKGVQGQIEWTRKWLPGFYTRADFALANKYFQKVIASASFYKGLKDDWEIELGGGYRRLTDNANMFTAVTGVAKELGPAWLNARVNLHHFHHNWHYNVLLQGRFFLGNAKHYLSFMGSLGSAPDMNIINYDLYDVFSPTNGMLGLGFHWLISERFAVACLGSWYNYKDDYYNSQDLPDYDHRNMYNLFLQFHVKF